MQLVHTDAKGWAIAFVCDVSNRPHMERFWAAFSRLGAIELPERGWEEEGLRVWVYRLGDELVGVRESYGEFIAEGLATILGALTVEVGPIA